MKKYILIICIVASISFLNAQNTLTNNDISFNKISYNTSYIGADTSSLVLDFRTSLSYNEQETNRLNVLVYGSIKKIGLGLGVKVNNRFKDFYRVTSGEFLINKRIKIKENHFFNFGLNMGLHYTGVNTNYFNNYVDVNDAEILSLENKYRFMAGAGFSYIWEKGLKLGFSMPELVKTESGFYPVFFANVSYGQKLLQSKKLILEPAVLLYSTAFVPMTFEGSVKLSYDDFVWLRVGGRSTKTYLVGVGGGGSFIHVGYTFNGNFGKYELINESQHNLNVNFRFLQAGKKKNDKKDTEL